MDDQNPVPVSPEISAYFAKIGRLGGLVGGRRTTTRKHSSCKRNGKLGGRPPKNRTLKQLAKVLEQFSHAEDE